MDQLPCTGPSYIVNSLYHYFLSRLAKNSVSLYFRSFFLFVNIQIVYLVGLHFSKYYRIYLFDNFLSTVSLDLGVSRTVNITCIALVKMTCSWVYLTFRFMFYTPVRKNFYIVYNTVWFFFSLFPHYLLSQIISHSLWTLLTPPVTKVQRRMDRVLITWKITAGPNMSNAKKL